MSQSKTPRTDHLINVILGRRVALDPEYTREQTILDHARDLEVDLTRLSAEKAELHTALLQAREDAQRYRWLREQTAPFKDWKVSMTYRAEGERPERLWLHGEHLDAAIDAARQAEPQEGEKG